MTTERKPETRPKSGTLPPTKRRMLDATLAIRESPPVEIDYLHTTMCQVGLPRSRTDEKVFERRSGNASLILEAGKLWVRGQWVDQPLPYGPHPRLVMVHLSSEAVRTQSRVIEIGATANQFLKRLGISTSGGRGGGRTAFKGHMQSLAACRLSLGYTKEGRDITISTVPIERFEAWTQNDDNQLVMWPGIMELSEKFYETLTAHAVPLDPRALGALKHSALALDIYCWLANRLYRIRGNNGVFLSWSNLLGQFGQEYSDPKNFQKEFKKCLRQVKIVYPDARLEDIWGGIKLYSSPPPISRKNVVVELPYKDEYIPWKDRTDLLDPKIS